MSRRRRRPWIAAGAVVSAAVLILLAREPLRHTLARRSTPYVVVVSIDTLNVEETGLYNPKARATPELDRLGEGGIVFQHAYTRVPITLPSHTTLFSGISPLDHTALSNGGLVPGTVTTLAEVFRNAGYQTAAFISLGVLSKVFGLDQGFDVYDDPFLEGEARSYRYAHEVFQSVSDWLHRSYRKPFFLWVHFSDPHEPYVPAGAPPDTRLSLDGRSVGEWNLVSQTVVRLPLTLAPGRHRLRWTSLRGERPDDRPETTIRLVLLDQEELARTATGALPPGAGVDLRPSFDLELVNRRDNAAEIELRFTGRLVRPAPSDVLDNYRKEVETTDRYVGELQRAFASLGIGDRVLWVIVSDHGEGLFHHDCLGHAEYLYEDQLRILWLLHGPGLPAGRRVEKAAVLMADVAPTLLDIVGLAAPKGPEGMEGRSRVGCWSQGPCGTRDEWWAYAVDHDKNRLTGIAGYRWPYKWIWRRGVRREAYAVGRDAREDNNLLDLPGPARPEAVKLLAAELRRQRRRFAVALRLQARLADHEKRLELLRSLGYIDPR